jgi:AbrB family looped-hinge helix DNA binding protein
MRTTMDRAGRLVIPKALRDRLGLQAGEVEITVEGAVIVVEPIFDDVLEQRDGRLVIPTSNSPISDELVRELRDADQR